MAILVGIGKYPRYSELAELHYPQKDVDLIEKELASQRYAVIALKDGEATRGAVLNAIQQAGEVLDPNSGAMVFFFSGHGFAERDTNYLATFDATRNALSQTGLPIPEVEKAMSKAGATRRILWIDACRDEPGKGVGDARTFTRFAGSAGTRILYSTKAGRVSYEDDALQQGLFSYYLIQGLRGEAAKSDGLISFRDLADYVTEGVESRSLRQGHVQLPYEAGESSGDFLVAKTGAGALGEPVSNPTAPSTMAGADIPSRRAPSFSLPDSKRQVHDIADYRGKLLILEFMNTACPHCIVFGGILDQVQKKYGDRAAILSVANPPDNEDTITKYISEHQVRHPILFDSGQVAYAYLRSVSFDIPHVYLIDANGNIRADFGYSPTTRAIFEGQALFPEIDRLM